jgi:hypothetical protein
MFVDDAMHTCCRMLEQQQPWADACCQLAGCSRCASSWCGSSRCTAYVLQTLTVRLPAAMRGSSASQTALVPSRLVPKKVASVVVSTNGTRIV